jgi:hypothetical protein
VKIRSGSLPGEGNLPIETMTALNARRIEHIVDHLSAVEDARIDHLMQRRRVADCVRQVLGDVVPAFERLR